MNRLGPIIFALGVLSTSLACRAVMSLIHPTSPDLTPAPQLTPHATGANQTSDCPEEKASILDASLGVSQLGGFSSGETTNPDIHLLAIYPVNGDQIGPVLLQDVPESLQTYQNETSLQLQSWNLFIQLIPASDRQELEYYQVITDGPGNVLASVEPTSKDPRRWVLKIDVADAGDTKNLVYTLIHEFGHLLTLNATQVPPDLKVFNQPDNHFIYEQEAAACTGYFTGEGCSLPRSYINNFFNRYWPGVYGEWQKIDDIQNDQRRQDRLDLFYDKYHDQFVDDYAVTDPAEDIAESWTYFILSPKPEGKTVTDQKILFFYEDANLVQLRSSILQRLCSIYP